MAAFDQPRRTDLRPPITRPDPGESATTAAAPGPTSKAEPIAPAVEQAGHVDPGRPALRELAAACEQAGLRATLREVGSRSAELRVWDPGRAGLAATIGCAVLEDSSEAGPARVNRWFTHGGQRLVLADDLPAAAAAVQQAMRIRM